MSLFQNWVICADYFGDELPLPLPTVKIVEQNKNKKKIDSNSEDTTAPAKILNIGAATDNVVGESKKDHSKNRALSLTPTFDGLFHFETMEPKKKNVYSTDTTAAHNAMNVGENKKDSSNNIALSFTPAFDGLHPFEMFVSC